MATKKKVKGSPDKMSVSEFKTWIKGLCAFADESWIPSKNQWEHILQVIDLLDDSVKVVHHAQSSGQVVLPTGTGQGQVYTGEAVGNVSPPAQQRFLGQPTDQPSGRSSEQLLPSIANQGQSEFT